jgi:hypothetical protein
MVPDMCPEGQAIAGALGAAYRQRVWVILVPEGLNASSSFVSEVLLQEEPELSLSHSATLLSALDG